MRAKARLTEAARDDVQDIWLFGADRWSVPQADGYEDGLRALIRAPAETPTMAPERGPISGIRVHPYRSHIIAFRVTDDGILVLRVLHGRSDWRRLLA